MWSKIVAWLAAHSPFGNPAAVQVVLYIMVAVFFCAMLFKCGYVKADEVSAARAQPVSALIAPAELEIQFGSTIVRGPTGVMGMNLRFPDVVAHYATLNFGFNIIGQSSWKCTNNTLCNDNQAVVMAQIVAPLPKGFELGIGVAHLQHADDFNCGPIDFSLSLEHPFFWDNIFWRYQHYSSAGTCSPNEGRDMIEIAYRFK
jgi:Lipid A 3-O-deacylase (PagL)